MLEAVNVRVNVVNVEKEGGQNTTPVTFGFITRDKTDHHVYLWVLSRMIMPTWKWQSPRYLGSNPQSNSGSNHRRPDRHHDHFVHGRLGSFRVVTVPPAPEHQWSARMSLRPNKGERIPTLDGGKARSEPLIFNLTTNCPNYTNRLRP